MKFKIEQIAINPKNPDIAKRLLSDLGLTQWVDDQVKARGEVMGEPDCENTANLSFNYQADRNGDYVKNDNAFAPLEFEILNYVEGENFCDYLPDWQVCHLGMHVTTEQLEEYRDYFNSKNIDVAQEVKTFSHENEVIKGKRLYHYVIFNTQHLIGVNLKFIVRLNPDGTPYSG
jgi:hypothetical protein